MAAGIMAQELSAGTLLVPNHNPKRRILIIDGTDCVGKTAVVTALQQRIPNHNIIKLSQAPRPYMSVEYILGVARTSVELMKSAWANTFIMDRSTMSTRVYQKPDEDICALIGEVEEAMSLQGAHHFLLTANETTLGRNLSFKRQEFPNEDHGTVEHLAALQHDYVRVYQDKGVKGLKYRNSHLIGVDSKSPSQIAEEVITLAGVEV